MTNRSGLKLLRPTYYGKPRLKRVAVRAPRLIEAFEKSELGNCLSELVGGKRYIDSAQWTVVVFD